MKIFLVKEQSNLCIRVKLQLNELHLNNIFY